MQTKNIPATAIMVVTKKGAAYTGNSGSMHNTARTWVWVQAHLAKNPTTTRGQLFTTLQNTNGKLPFSHPCFVRYALGAGWLAAK